MKKTARPNLTLEYLQSQGLSADFPRRFISKVQITETHWLWTGTTRFTSNRCPKGHGQIQRMNGMNWKIYAHRAAWILFVGPIPEGKMVLHNCPGEHIPFCVRPEHLKLGDGFENMRDMTKAGHNYFANHFGENHPKAKLTAKQRKEILARLTGKYGEVSAIAREYGVTPSCIFHIRDHINWKKQ